MKLNAYLANAGITSRRKAAELIKEGKVTINHFPQKDPSYEVQEKDTVRVGKKIMRAEKKVYILFNKPPRCVTSTTDPEGRKTVLDFVKVEQRLYPVGRLDYDTTGLILLTNDGELAQKLAHPRYSIEKTYNVILDRPLEHDILLALKKGVRLRDGFAKVDEIVFKGPSGRGLNVTIHSGKYRIIRRLFEHFSYLVDSLDRISFAGLNKKGLPRGKWRFLSPKDVEILQSL